MGPTAEFHMADTLPRDDSGESVMTDSDLEGFEAEEWAPGDTSRYHWLGKRVFDGILTHVVFDESELSSMGEDLESAVITKLAGFPFDERSKQLNEMVPSDSRVRNYPVASSAFQRFATLLGRIYSSATDDMKDNVTTLVREGRSNTSAQPAGQPAGAGTATSSTSPTEPQGAQNTARGLNRYTSALDRYCDREGLAVDWPTTEVPAARLKFRCVARVGGLEFEGLGKNTRDARHTASRKACAAFGVEV